MKKRAFAGIILAAFMAVSASACDFSNFGGYDDDTALTPAPSAPEQNITPSDLYEEWLERGNTGSYSEFLKEYLSYDLANSSGYDVDTIQHNLLSTVSVYCSFGSGSNSSVSGGSGVIIELDKENGNATVLTNYHVVYGSSTKSVSKDICLYLYGAIAGKNTDGSLGGYGAMQATYLGGSMTHDVAVLQIRDNEILKNSAAEKAKIGDSEKVTVGESVVAIGNAEGEGLSVTTGVLSVDSEMIEMTAADDTSKAKFRVMRTDAAINHGNSGGPLFNAKGELIGINNAKSVADEVDAMNYSLPITKIMFAVENILDNGGSISRAKFGVTISTINSRSEWDEKRGRVKIVETIQIADITEDSASDGIFKVGDILVSMQIGGEEVQIERNFQMIDRTLTIRLGDVVKVKVFRGGEEKELSFSFDKASYFEAES